MARAVARAIVRDIVAQGLGEGAPLPAEAAMTVQYGVGRVTLREALRLLEQNGLISIRTGRSGGPRVRRSDSRDLARLVSLHLATRRVTYAQLSAARRRIEPTLARLAALNATESERQELAELVHLTVEALPDIPLHYSTDFHRRIAVLSHEPVLGPLSVALQIIVRPVAVVPTRAWTELNADHVPLGEAIVRGDSAEAETLMARHIDAYPELEQLDEVVAWT